LKERLIADGEAALDHFFERVRTAFSMAKRLGGEYFIRAKTANDRRKGARLLLRFYQISVAIEAVYARLTMDYLKWIISGAQCVIALMSKWAQLQFYMKVSEVT
jgi:hypothetical protein